LCKIVQSPALLDSDTADAAADIQVKPSNRTQHIWRMLTFDTLLMMLLDRAADISGAHMAELSGESWAI
jgi:hypothetical protein